MNQCHVRDDRAGQEERCGISRPRLSFSLILVLPGFFLFFSFFLDRNGEPPQTPEECRVALLLLHSQTSNLSV